jgi:putative ABC transport system permease protein
VIAPPAGTASILELSWLDLALASALVLVAMAIAAWQRIGIVRGLAIGAVRAVVQLVAVGYILAFLITTRRPLLVLLTLVVMLIAATITATERQKRGRARLFVISGTAMLLGAGFTLAYVDAVILRYPGVPPMFTLRDPDGNRLYIVEHM